MSSRTSRVTWLALCAAAFSQASGQDITRPGDALTPSSGNHPAGEAAPNAIDNTASTKYLNFDRVNCDDGVQGPGEEGADCGFVCSAMCP